MGVPGHLTKHSIAATSSTLRARLPTVIPTGNDAVVLGLNDNGDSRTIVYIPSGGDNAPVRFYYLDPTP
jgi:hypothetical protein